MDVIMLNHIVIAGIFAGISLLFHLISARNFVPSSEMWMVGSLFSYVHSLLNLIAQISLVCVVVVAVLEHYKSGVISRVTGINRHAFPIYIFKFIAAAFLASLVRMILPGPVTYYSFFYKLSVFLNLVATAGLVANDRSLLRQVGFNPFQNFARSSVAKSSIQSTKKDDAVTPDDDDDESRSRRWN